MYILNVIKNLFRLLDRTTRNKYLLLQIFSLFSALIQVAGVASIAPFIGVISNPDIIHENKILAALYQYFAFSSNIEFITAFAMASLVLIFVSNLLSGLTQWLSFRFSIYIGSKLQNDLIVNLLGREYIYHKVHDSGEAIALINQEAPRFVYMVLQPFLSLTSQLFIAFIILVGLVMLDPVIAMIAGAIIGGSYLITYVFLKRSLLHHGKVLTERNSGVQSVLAEAFTGVKEIKMGGKEGVYKEKFGYYNRRGLVSTSFIALAGDIPKLVIESIAFGAILVLAIVLLHAESDASRIVSILSLYGLAGYKLLPAMQQVYKSLSNISSNGAVVMRLAHELEFKVDIKGAEVFAFNEEIHSVGLRNASFMYPNAEVNALNSVNALFKKGRVNVIAGLSGSGKSTLADIVLGLLPPSDGSLMVNELEVEEGKVISYQRSIGYVPQNIFLTNESVLANVAFGVELHEIDKDKVARALKLANAEEFTSRLPQGVDTVLGQDGKLLSGGQRQRIGIARALYRDAKILVFDEPTSALDIHSEHEFMSCLNNIKHQYLIVLISHSPSVMKLSDKIYLMDGGELKASGEFGTLINEAPSFRSMMSKVDLPCRGTHGE